MLDETSKKALSDREDTKLAVDGIRAVFCENGEIHPKHRRALDALARFCKVSREGAGRHAIDHGTDPTEIIRTMGRQEVYNFIMFCLEYPDKQRHKLVEEIKELEDQRDARRTDDDSDYDGF